MIHSPGKWSAVAHLLQIRMMLRVQLVRHPLDAVLLRLSHLRRPLPFAEVERALVLAESIVANVPWVGASCLYRSLGRFGLFRAYGWPAVFVLGISPKFGSEKGHAWVELDGVPYRESGTDTFLISFIFPSAPS